MSILKKEFNDNLVWRDEQGGHWYLWFPFPDNKKLLMMLTAIGKNENKYESICGISDSLKEAKEISEKHAYKHIEQRIESYRGCFAEEEKC